MKKIIFLTLFLPSLFLAQSTGSVLEGKVTYVTLELIYVQFSSTKGIAIGDTLYNKNSNNLINPSMIVKSRSSKSVSAKLIGASSPQKGDLVIAYYKEKKKKENKRKAVVVANSNANTNTIETRKARSIKYNQLSGRLSVSSYSSVANIKGWGSQRWRYRFSLDGENLFSSSVGLESYMTFSYRTDRTNLIKENINNALRIYSLAVSAKPTENIRFSLGRRINKTVTNLGAYDGADLEVNFSGLTLGTLVGSRPSWNDYSFNFNFFQYGVYLSKENNFNPGNMKNSIGFFNQTNHGKTDRRFLYYQHSNNLIPKVRMFASLEADLFEKRSGIEKNKFKVTSLFLSLRYAPNRTVSFSGSYDARRNVIYYETFTNYADSLLDAAMRQGIRLRMNFRPTNHLNLGIGGGFRKMKSNIDGAVNLNLYAGYSRLPSIGGSMSLSYNFVNTNYVMGNIAGLRYNKNLFSGMANVSLGYRNITYIYTLTESMINQNILEFGMYLNFSRSISFSINYEGIFEGNRTQGLIYANLNTRF